MTIGPIVSAAHLLQSGPPALSELEYALVLANNAFQRWITQATTAAGAEGLSPMEVQILHSVHHRERPKTIAQICLMLNIEDTHLVTYAARKLRDRGLVADGRAGKEKTLVTTAEGAALCQRYGEVRKSLLGDVVSGLQLEEEDMSRLAALLRALSGSYDQASRSAASL